MPEIQLAQGTIRYHDEGSGPVVVLIHGLLVNGRVWDPVVELLSRQARCIVPDLPIGSHPIPVRAGVDLSPPGVAGLIAELIERLGLKDVTLVGNDTGGALCQLVCTHHPERIGALVLINCDAFENFPPPAFRLVVKALAHVPGAVAALGQVGRLRVARKATMSLAPLTVKPIPDERLRSWIAPLRDRGVRRDLVAFLRGISPQYTIEAAEHLRRFDRPALLIWGLRDRFFPLAEAERLQRTLPDARIEEVSDARTFVQLDAPSRVAELITAFVDKGATVST